ncbi:MAG: T9SS type A sorting domain-containing protein [Bacteroidetes bacterium]|nr:T9SS type A sorting domain-containing protein [Bacteroidota bacterium]
MKSKYLKLLSVIAFVFVVEVTKSQSFAWAQQFGSIAADASYYSITDATGNVYIVGGFSGTVDFDPGVGTSNVTSVGGTDGYVVKLNSSGVFQWVRTIGGTGTDRVHSISIDATGNLYIAGIFNGTVDFDPGAGTFNLTSAGSEDVFISKWNSTGNFVWAGRLAGAGSQDANQILVDASGNVYVVGEFTQTVDFDPGAGSVTAVANTSTPDMYILKLTTTGVFSWVRTYGSPVGTDFDRAEDIDFDASGNLVIVGDFSGTIDFDPGAGTFNLISNGVQDAFVLKLNTSGNFVSAFNFGGVNSDKIEDVEVDASGNIYVTGYFQGSVDFDPSASSFSMTSAGGSDIFVAKYSATGSFLWAKRMGTSTTAGGLADTGFGIAVNSLGEVFSAGEFRGNNCDFDPGTGTFLLSAGATNSDLYIQKLDANGNFLFAQKIGGTNLTDFAGSVWFDGVNNAIYVCGSFNGNSDFDGGAATYTMQTAGNTDGFILKLSACIAPSAPVNVTSSTLLNICSGNSTTLTTTSTGTVTWHSTSTSTTVLNNGLSYVTPTLTAGTFTYYAQSNTACGASASRTPITVTVTSSPTIVITPSASALCSGQSATLTASGAGSYTWSTGGTNSAIVVSPTSTATYSVTGMNSNCYSDRTVTVTVTPTPTINITPSTSTLCSGQSATLTASGASSYAWSTGGTNSGIVVSPTLTTTYSVTGTTSGCSSSNTFTVQVSICNSVHELEFKNSVIVYPNPTSGTVLVNSNTEIERIELINMLGQRIEEFEMTSNKLSIHIAEEGHYILILVDKDGRKAFKKVIVEK